MTDRWRVASVAGRFVGTTAAVLVIAAAVAPPAHADNCGSLSDCSPTQFGIIMLLGGLLGLGIVVNTGGLPRKGPPPTPPPQPPPPQPEPQPQPQPNAPPPPAYDPNRNPPDDSSKAQKKAAAEQKIRDNSGPGKHPKDWVKYVDTSGDGVNCADVAEAVDRTLGGNPTAASDRTGKREYQSQQEHNRQYQPESMKDIEQQVKNGGPGTRGIVHVADDQGNRHAFNVYNDGGKVVWIDGQSPPIISGNRTDFLNKIGYPGGPNSRFMQTWP